MIYLQSTTISDFFNGVAGGIDAMVSCDKSSFVNIRGTAIKLL